MAERAVGQWIRLRHISISVLSGTLLLATLHLLFRHTSSGAVVVVNVANPTRPPSLAHTEQFVRFEFGMDSSVLVPCTSISVQSNELHGWDALFISKLLDKSSCAIALNSLDHAFGGAGWKNALSPSLPLRASALINNSLDLPQIVARYVLNGAYVEIQIRTSFIEPALVVLLISIYPAS